MSGGFSLYIAAAAAIVGAIAAYWSTATRRRAFTAKRPEVPLLLLIAGCALSFCLWSVYLERPAVSYEHRAEPLAIAIAFDLSPSMLAIPDPAAVPEALPRYQRGKDVLLGTLRAIEERDAAAMVTIVGFSRHADVIMGWNRDVGQAGEVIRHALSPDDFGKSGTSMEAAADALADVFNMLPATFEDARRLAIVVSDGEDTMRKASFGYAVDTISRAGFDVIALQAGSLDADEGVPAYDGAGEFMGFERIGGKLHTRPDFAAMEALAMARQDRGLYLRAETPDASRRMLEFAYSGAPGRTDVDTALLPALGMFGAVFVLLAWLIR